MQTRQTQVISLIGRKGGITKTTLAVNLAAGCALRGLRTVVIDADGQANASKIMRAAPAPGVFDLLLGDKEFSEVLKPVDTKFAGAGLELYILPSDDSQRQVEQHPATAARIVERLPELDGWADVVIVDTSPGITEVHAGFYYASDWVLLPTTLEFSALTSLDATLTYLAQAAREGAAAGYDVGQVMGIIPNRFATSERVQQSNQGWLRGRYSQQYRVFDAIRNLTVWNQTSQMRTSIFAYAPEDDYNARRQAKAAARELTVNKADGEVIAGPLAAILGLFAEVVA